MFIERTKTNTWRYLLPTYGMSGECSSREDAQEEAIESIRQQGKDWKSPAEFLDAEFQWLEVNVQPVVPQPLDWRVLQQIALRVLGRQCSVFIDDQDTLHPGTSHFLADWEVAGERPASVELTIQPEQLGGDLEFNSSGVPDASLRDALRAWFWTRFGNLLPDYDAFEDLCRVLAGPLPSGEEFTALIGYDPLAKDDEN